MSIFNPLDREGSAILSIVAKKPLISVADIHKSLKTRFGYSMSLQNTYRRITQMVEAQMLVRDDGRHSIHQVWLAHLASFVEQAKATSTSSITNNDLKDIASGGERRYQASSLRELDPIWSDILAKLVPIAQQNTWHIYNSHPWYLLGMPDTELRVFEGLTLAGVRLNVVYGGVEFLDRYALRQVKIRGVKLCNRAVPELPREGYNLWVCGEFLVECTFHSTISNHFAFFFRNIQSASRATCVAEQKAGGGI